MKSVFRILLSLFVSTSVLASEDLTKQLEDLENRLATIEAERSLQVFSFSSYLSAGIEAIDLEAGQINLHRMKAAINANAKVSNNLYFYSQLWMSKYFNNIERQGFSEDVLLTNLFSNSSFDSNQVRFSKIYFDYFFDVGPSKMALSVGRLPTANGPPSHFREGQGRQGTYPFMSYTVELDGFALTSNLSHLVGDNQSLVFRGVYSPFSMLNYNNDPTPIVRPVGLNNEKKDTTTDVGSLVLEYATENLNNGFFSGTSTIFQYLFWKDGSLQDVIVSAIPGVSNENRLVSHPDDMFDLHFYSLYHEFKNLFNWSLDFSASYMISSVKTKQLAQSVITGSAVNLGFRNDGLGWSSAGLMMLSMVKEFNWEFLNRPSFGVEYLKGDKNLLSPNEFNSIEDETAFYSTMGKAYHVYWLQPIEDSLMVRFGYRQQDREFSSNLSTQAGLGASQDDNQTIRTIYGQMVMQF